MARPFWKCVRRHVFYAVLLWMYLWILSACLWLLVRLCMLNCPVFWPAALNERPLWSDLCRPVPLGVQGCINQIPCPTCVCVCGGCEGSNLNTRLHADSQRNRPQWRLFFLFWVLLFPQNSNLETQSKEGRWGMTTVNISWWSRMVAARPCFFTETLSKRGTDCRSRGSSLFLSIFCFSAPK